MTGPHEQPDDDVLFELGKLTWTAINFEDVVYFVCQCIEPTNGYRDTATGTRIKQAREALQVQPDEALRARADAWLGAASEALAERHAVLHSEPVSFVPLAADLTPVDLDRLLAHFPRDRSRGPVHTPLTVLGLRAIRWRLEAARGGWEELATELYTKKVW